MVQKKWNVWLPLLFAIVLIIGMILGFKLSKSSGKKSLFSKSKASQLQESLQIIERNYVDSVNIDSLESLLIQQLVDALDPHSAYYTAKETEEAGEDLSGEYVGIGVEYLILGESVYISNVFENSQAFNTGLNVGDEIIEAGGIALVGKYLNTDSIYNLFHGANLSKLHLKYKRDEKIFSIAITRKRVESIPVEIFYMINKNTGYIKLNKFSENSYEWFMKSLESLKQKGMQQLIFDLRNNTGGYLQEAVDIIDEFLDGEKLALYTQGLNSKKTEYRCKRPGLFETGKLILFINEQSASASEAVAGALQDWDRATVLGRTSYGKGLAQENFYLSNGSSLLITTSRYYTPLGRCIQRPYGKGRELYINDFVNRYYNGNLTHPDSVNSETGRFFKTPKGKILHDAGGIIPDVFVASDTAMLLISIPNSKKEMVLKEFALKWYLGNKKLLQSFTSYESFAQNTALNKKIESQFLGWQKNKALNISPLFVQKYLTFILCEIVKYKWGKESYHKYLNNTNDDYKMALSLFPKN